jgi:hypothetical protein
MVLSTRRAVLLVALVGVLALGIMGLLRGVSASPGNADDHNGSEGRSTLTVLAKIPEIKVLDLGPKGPSHGDLRVANAPLYDESGKEKVGRLDLFCVVTDPADESAEKAHMAQYTYTYTLPGGEISAQSVRAYPELSGLPIRGVDALGGGTGKYAGVRGEVHIDTRGTKVIHTFHSIGYSEFQCG